MQHVRLLRVSLLLLICLVALSEGKRLANETSSAERWVSPTGNDRGSGSSKNPWATLQRAASDAKSGMIVHVLAGRYVGPVHTRISGAPSRPIRFVSEEKWKAQIVESSSAEAVWENDGDYIEINGFDVSGTPCVGILNNGSHVRILNNHVHDVARTAGCGKNGGAGIDNASFKAGANEIVGNWVNGIGDPATSSLTIHGIYHSNAGGSIRDNVAACNAGWGIHLWHAATAVEIANNVVTQNRYGGIVVGAGDAPGGVINDGTHVDTNLVVSNRYGIFEFGATGPNNRFQNNWIYGNSADALRLLTGSASGNITRDPEHAPDAPKSAALLADGCHPKSP
jgi:hypothetical protein